ncbi:hypothetical protein JXA88_17235 [Candidatus Fermentibacteria bacterium]|nr:hypothetical protein [Candidatus Fermentibacteria bacterium]
MRRIIPCVAVAVLAAGILKQATWALWLPPGALPEEVGQYLAISRAGGAFDPGMERLAPKDLAELARFARLEAGHLPVKSALDLRRLNAALAGITTAVLVPAEVSSPPSSSYHSLLSRLLSRLLATDIRWRWVLMRLVGIAFLAFAAVLTYRALREGSAPHLAALAGMILVMYGPAAGMGAGLLGPSAFVACLWGAWILCLTRMKSAWEAAPWAALVGLAMSSVDVQGGVACAVTLAVVAAAGAPRQGLLPRITRWATIVLSVIGLVLWVFRLLTMQRAAPAAPWQGVLFAAPSALLPVPVVLLVVWGAVGVVALAGLVIGLRGKKVPMAFAIGAAVLFSLLLGRIWPSPGMAALSTSPLMAYLIVQGCRELWRQSVGWVALAAVAVILDWAALLHWVLPRLFA